MSIDVLPHSDAKRASSCARSKYLGRHETKHSIRNRTLALATDALAENLISTECARKELLRVKHGGIGGASFVRYTRKLAMVLFYVRKLLIKNL
jgi:hypothetical protein